MDSQAIRTQYSGSSPAFPLQRKAVDPSSPDPRTSTVDSVVIGQAKAAPAMDRDAAIDAVSEDGMSLRDLDASLRADPEVVLAAVEQNPQALVYADRSLLQDEDFLWSCFERSYGSIQVMRNVLGLSIPPRLQEEYERLWQQLMDLGINTMERFANFTLEDIEELIANRQNLIPDDRPLAVVVYPQNDGGAFDIHPILELMRNGYRVVYYEARVETDLYRAIQEGGRSQPIDLLLIGGHGNPEMIALSSACGTIQNPEEETCNIDISDYSEMTELGLGNYMAEDGVVIAEGCSVAEGENDQPNLAANILGNVFLNNPVFASTDLTIGTELIWEGGRVVGARFIGEAGRAHTFSTFEE